MLYESSTKPSALSVVCRLDNERGVLRRDDDLDVVGVDLELSRDDCQREKEPASEMAGTHLGTYSAPAIRRN